MAAKLLPLIYGLAFVFIVIPALPVAEFGRFSIVFSFYNLIAVLNRSLLLHPMMRFGAAPDDFGRMARAGLQLSALFCLACALSVWGASAPLAAMFRVERGDVATVALLVGVFFFREYGFFIQQTRYRTGRIFVIEAVFFLGAAAGFWGLANTGQLRTGGDALTVVMVAAALSSLTALLLGAGGIRGIMRWDGEAIRTIARYGVKTLPTGVAGSLLSSADVLIIGAVWTPVEAAVYNGAKAVYRVTAAATQAAGLLVTPYAARLTAEKNLAGVKELFEKSAGYIFAGLALATAVGWVAADFFYAHFLGGAYRESAMLLKVLLLGAPLDGIYNVTGGILYGMGRAGVVSLVSVGAAGVFIAGVFPMTMIWGPMGCSAAVVSAAVVGGGAMFAVAARLLGTGVKGVVKRLAAVARIVIK